MKRRKGQLVSQHLENISRKALENYQGLIKEFVKGRHGVYALYSKGRLYYVGLASNLRNRLKTHLKDRHAHTWDSFSVYLTIKDAHLKELETLILKVASPKGNKQEGKFIKSQDLKPFFKRKVTRAQKEELNELFGIISDKKPKIREIKKVDGKTPVLAPYVKKRFQIRRKYKGKLYRATVRQNGTVFYSGKIYNSPSVAGYSIARHPVNGWTFWTYQRAPGDWVQLDYLRRK